MKIIRNELPPTIPQGYVAIDSEWWAINEKTLHRPTSGRFACLTIATNFDDVYWIDKPELVEPALQRVEDAVWLLHLGKFDFTHLRRICPIPPRKKFVDTLLMDRLLWNGYYDTFGENDLARRYLSEYMDKTLQKSFGEDLGTMTEDQIQYSCLDVNFLMRIWPEQKKHITNTHMKLWKEIEQPLLWAVLDMQSFRMDVIQWLMVAEENQAKAKEIDASLPVNPRSYKKLLPYLRENGFKNIPSTGEDILLKWFKKYPNTKAGEYVGAILESRSCTKNASTYGTNFIENFIEDDDKVFADWHTIGTETGRFSASNPHMQTIPVRDTKVYRECFIPREGNEIVVADISAQEYYISAFISQDPKMLEICRTKQDPYVGTAKIMYGVDIEKSDPLRKKAKSIALGMDYGMSEYGLADKLGTSKEEAAELVVEFRHSFPVFAAWMDQQERKKKCVQTVLGRTIWLNPYSSQCPRNALNAPMQGTAADQLKVSIVNIYKKWDFGCPFGLVAPVHDELVFDVPKKVSKDVAQFVKSEMEKAANEICPGLGFKAEVFIGDSWSCKE